MARYLVLLLILLIQHGHCLHFFTGQTSIEHYIATEICRQPQPRQLISRLLTILVSPNTNPAQSQYSKCFDLILTSPDSLATLFSLQSLQFKQFSVFLDYSAEQLPSKEHYLHVLFRLNKLHSNCLRCHPFIVMLDRQISRLPEWTEAALPRLASNFSLILTTKHSEPSHVFLRPLLNGCASYPGVFVPQSKSDLAQLQIPSRDCNLHGQQFNISVSTESAFCDVAEHPNGTVYFKSKHNKMDTLLLDFLMQKYNFTSSLLNANNSWGIKLVNGTWTGMVGHLYSGQADIGICCLTRTYTRLQYIDFTHFTYMDSVGFMTMKPNRKTRDWLIAYPFQFRLWICVAIALPVLSVMVFSLSKIHATSHNTFDAVCLNFYRIIVNQSSRLSFSSANSTRLLVATWLITALVLTNAYSGFFCSILAVTEFDRPIDTVQELLNYLEKPQTVIVTANVYANEISNATASNWLYYHLRQYAYKTLVEKAILGDEQLLSDFAPHFAFIHTRMIFKTFAKSLGDYFHVGAENLNDVDTIAVGLRKRSPLLEPFNRAIQQLLERGLLERWAQLGVDSIQPIVGQPFRFAQFAPDGTTSTSGQLFLHQTNLKELQSVYLLWTLGVVIAVFLFALEIVYQKVNDRRLICDIG